MSNTENAINGTDLLWDFISSSRMLFDGVLIVVSDFRSAVTSNFAVIFLQDLTIAKSVLRTHLL